MPSPQPSKRILGNLELYLRERITPPRKLIGMGWRDFRAIDHPETADVVTMACEAFAYLSFTDDGNWNENLDVLIAVKAYLDAETGREPGRDSVSRLATVLRQKPVIVRDVQDWFDTNYRL